MGARVLARLAKVDVLVIDDWGLAPLKEQERRDMLDHPQESRPPWQPMTLGNVTFPVSQQAAP